MSKTDTKVQGDGSTDGAAPIVSIRDLKVHFDLSTRGLIARALGRERERIVKAVDGISFDVRKGETLGLVGESGCGKSTTGRAILQLIKPTGGQVLFDGVNLAALSEGEMRPYRRHLQMIFQDPYASLNPRMTVGSIISEPIRTFELGASADVMQRTQDLMRTVGLNPRYVKRYPHEFSGGQRQRIGIARALAAEPDFIVADEPISALDVSIQAQIMNLMEDLQQEFGLTYLFISHDLRAVRHVSDRVIVMYLGEIAELADSKDIYKIQIHPYTKALISAVPVPDPQVEKTRQRIVLQGDVPSPINPPTGCHFHTRCPFAIAECARLKPILREIMPGHFATCIRVSPEHPDVEEVAAMGKNVYFPEGGIPEPDLIERKAS
jgi:oligopeptide transport system ATP-binding protein